MAEFVMKELVRKEGLEEQFLIESAATSREELGNDIHYGTRQKLIEQHIPFERRSARQIKNSDYEKYDFLIAMDDENIFYMKRCWQQDFNKKIVRLLSFAGKTRDIADPWYTGNFNQTYDDILEGCKALLNYLKDKKMI